MFKEYVMNNINNVDGSVLNYVLEIINHRIKNH